MSSTPPSGGVGSVPRKLIAAQAVVVVGLVALIYFTLLRPDEGGPPRVVDAPGETQAQLPGGDGPRPGDGQRRNGAANPDRRPGDSPDGPGSPRSGSRGTPGQGSPAAPGPAGDPGARGAPGGPAGPPGPGTGAPPGLGGDGGYGPGDDQYGNSITRLEERIGLGSVSSSP